MTYLDGIHAGLYLLGVLCVLGALALLVLAAVAIDVPHRVRVAKLRRDMRRSGRRTYDPTTGRTSDGINLGPRRRPTGDDDEREARYQRLRQAHEDLRKLHARCSRPKRRILDGSESIETGKVEQVP